LSFTLYPPQLARIKQDSRIASTQQINAIMR
jgi:hypothetical protein